MIRLYLDEDIHKRVSTSLMLQGYNIVSAHELEKWGLTDRQQLEFAVSEERTIFTFNVQHFTKLHLEYLGDGRQHYGIIVSKQLPL